VIVNTDIEDRLMSNEIKEKMGLVKFGVISEIDGRLYFTDFHINGKGRFENTRSDIALLTLVKERIEKEINDIWRITLK